MANSSTARRIQKEISELARNPSNQWKVMPVDDDMYEWHFTIRGPEDSDFERGLYHGRICLPMNYPFAPPSIMLLTPNGRFEINKKICLSVSNFHPELWQPAWGIRTILEALRSFFPTPAEGAVGGLDWPSDVRRKIAVEETPKWRCEVCKATNEEILPNVPPEDTDTAERLSTSPVNTEAFRTDPAPTRACTTDFNSPMSGIPLAAVDPFPFWPNALEAAGAPHLAEGASAASLLPSNSLSLSELPARKALPKQEGESVCAPSKAIQMEHVQPGAQTEEVQNNTLSPRHKDITPERTVESSTSLGESAKVNPSSDHTEVAPVRQAARERRSPIMMLLPSLPQDRQGIAVMCVDVLILNVIVALGYFCHSVAIRPPF